MLRIRSVLADHNIGDHLVFFDELVFLSVLTNAVFVDQIIIKPKIIENKR